jgi:hypothetical protein
MDYFLLEGGPSAARVSNAASRKAKQWVKGATQIIAVIVTFRKSNKNSPVLQQMLKMMLF